MPGIHRGPLTSLFLLFLFVVDSTAADPTDNPVATFYSGPEGYPTWTDAFQWSRVINMKTYTKGKTEYEKFVKARDELKQGGILYYPAGIYDFASMPPGVGLMLKPGIVIRGEAPSGRPIAADGKLTLGTKFTFAFRDRGGGKVPADWNFVGIHPDHQKNIKTVDRLGICWVHLVGATIAWGPQVDWGKTWNTAKALYSDQIKGGWNGRDPSGTHPFDALAGGGKKYQGAGMGRLVFGCVFEDAAVLDDFTDPGYGADGFFASIHCARVMVYGSRVLVANNLLPRSRRNFKYRQKTDVGKAAKGGTLVQFDYGRTCGIDINKELLAGARADGTCPGYFEEGIVVRDNYVFNHGHTGFNIAGNWATITGNNNDRVLLRNGDDVYGIGGGWTLTLDGYNVSGPNADNRSRAFDLAGRNLWIDSNRFNNTGSMPGNDGEGIVGRPTVGTHVYSWAITRNIHTRGTGSASALGAMDADCRGLLIGWNQATGWVGNAIVRPNVKMMDCSFVANKCERFQPDEKAITRLGLPSPLTSAAPGTLVAPAKLTASIYKDDAVKLSWSGSSDGAVAIRVERRIGEGKWQVIAYRPPRPQGDAENPQEWIDFTAPSTGKLTYRVVAVTKEDNDKGASEPTVAISFKKE